MTRLAETFNTALARQWNNDLYCAEAFPARMLARLRVLEQIKEDGELTIDPPTPAWVTSNRFANRLTGLTDRGQFYLNILKTASDEKMQKLGYAGMYFAGTKEEQQDKEREATYMRPTYTDVSLLEDVTHEKFGVYLNPLGDYFTGRWVKYDEEGYHRL